jgi:phosphomannomutase
LLDQREAMWRRYGLYVSRRISKAFEGSDADEKMAAAMTRYRDNPPWPIANLNLPETYLLVFEPEGGDRVILRASATAPTLEYYLHVRIEIAAEENVEAAIQRGNARIDKIAEALRA